jgi:large subunit ribosomal protein L13e
MPNFRLQIPNAHFHKHWHDQAAHKGRIVTWHNQAARKHRRRENRLAKAQAVFPRPVNGLLRPVVHCQTIRYNSKKRAGKGFTLEELKEAGINRREARGVGISVDYRRKNRSEQSLRENVARLAAYKANLIVFPKKQNRKKPAATDSSKAEQGKAEQVIGDVMPIVKPKPTIVPYKITQVSARLCSLPFASLPRSSVCRAPKECDLLDTSTSRLGVVFFVSERICNGRVMGLPAPQVPRKVVLVERIVLASRICGPGFRDHQAECIPADLECTVN